MRLPFRKLHRAFRELDGFSDADCARFIDQAGKRDPWGVAVAAVLALAAFFVIAVGWWQFIWTLGELRVFGPSGAILLAFSPLLGAIAALLIRDLWLRRAVRMQLRRGACHECGYSLLGLRVENDALHCPECGRRFTLQETGMTAEELLAGALTRPGTSSAPPPAAPP